MHYSSVYIVHVHMYTRGIQHTRVHVHHVHCTCVHTTCVQVYVPRHYFTKSFLIGSPLFLHTSHIFLASPTHLLAIFWHVPDRLLRLHVDKVILLATDNLSKRFFVRIGFTLCCTITLLVVIGKPPSLVCFFIVAVTAPRFLRINMY